MYMKQTKWIMIIWFIQINNSNMGKKEKRQVSVEQAEVPLNQVEKKPLRQFLPHAKYTKARNIQLKKKRNSAIETIKLDKFQVKKAVSCLLEFAEKNKNPTDLFGEQGFIYLQIDMGRIPEEHSVRPIQIELPHPIYSAQLNSRYTIIVEDPEEAFTDKLAEMNVPMVQDVIGYEKMKKNFKQSKDKKSLLAANDLFFCDWKIYNLLRQPLGKLFYQKKKFPFPIDCSGEVPEELKQQCSSYEEYINKLAHYTYVMLGNGPAYTLKVGRTTMDVKQIVKNVIRGAYGLISHIIDGKISAKHVRQISIKTYNSPSLPIYCGITEQERKAYKKHGNQLQ